MAFEVKAMYWWDNKNVARNEDISAWCFYQPQGILTHIQSCCNQMFGYKIVCISDDEGYDDGDSDDDDRQA